mmetsp:Transcript_35831/g.49733  ORF Transcript_35831/g.49733 Transcript_35831/m.49733 type:complete len:227 (+) Transcript_35831:268-948(+)|eukprot:CAMPEP_0196583684 /NCGR_PEP_ID=MMETSP1081-20130531/44316_1 /TAXON_ID=36882 /ORGANISM="Pyramimonas amylifera, Strain CCMP720" /LENGTH=226 /DNA_ID=CAMNT_0041904639 /DNA_START=263 /DNA_END=943 /DNA_ORIENTATION=+
METSSSVPLLRVVAEEQVYERESLLGRDTSSVFPSEAQTDTSIKDNIGGLKFVTESELAEIKAARGECVEDGTASQDKHLAQVLAENKEKKEEAFQEIWRSMKVGKNRPLDDDEADFYDHVAKQSWQKERGIQEDEEEELAAFKLAREEHVVFISPTPAPSETNVSKPQDPSQIKRKGAFVNTSMAKVRIVAKKAPIIVKDGEDDTLKKGFLIGFAEYGSSDNDSD